MKAEKALDEDKIPEYCSDFKTLFNPNKPEQLKKHWPPKGVNPVKDQLTKTEEVSIQSQKKLNKHKLYLLVALPNVV